MDQMTDLEMDQQRHGYFHPEPCILLRGGDFSQTNIHTVTASGNITNIDSHYLPDAYDSAVMYGVTQYNGIQHQHNLDMGVAAATNLYYPGMNPSSSTGILPVPLNHRASDQLPASSSFAVSGVSSDNYGRSSGFTDDVRGLYKRKTAEGIRGNFQCFNPSASSVPPQNARHLDGVAIMDAASFSLPQFPVRPHGSTWSRSSEAVMMNEHNHVFRGNYLGQHFQPVAPPWLDQQLNSNNGDGHTAAWNPSLRMPYMQAPNLNGSSLENANMDLQRYRDTASSRSGLRFLHPPPANHQHHNYHHPTLSMPGVRGHNVNFLPPVTGTSYRVLTNPSRSTVIPAQNGFEMGTRHVGPSPSAGQPIFRPHRRVLPETNLRHRNLPHMSVLQVDDVAILDMQDFYEAGYVDNHRDMRLDIEDMSYEELLALGERIGNVSTGLSDEILTRHLRTKTFETSAKVINLEEEAAYESEDQETESCIICQDEYKNGEKIGILQCGHEYHESCLKKWLLVKNVCPVCKSEAMTPGRKGL
ncbi:hypothetical protein L6164_022626 [Bauhinia variegata]|uniref:Uncharacterized protein n=1 Tax=Bauhinia variegata TaxID=167791 RepID=A0ACB9MIN7_BAUVA|nr:hypothetical protein L6164_022626 [Bauhinia variegata]